MEKLIREYLKTLPEVSNVEFNYNSTFYWHRKFVPFHGCQITIYYNPTIVPTKSLALTLNNMFDLKLGESETKWRLVTIISDFGKNFDSLVSAL